MNARDELATIISRPEEVDHGPLSCGPNSTFAGRVADAILAAGYTKRETVTEWAAGFRVTGEIYNFHPTLEEAQRFVYSRNAEGADMVVMTREVLPRDASEWQVTA
jgi:hypothetical protein